MSALFNDQLTYMVFKKLYAMVMILNWNAPRLDSKRFNLTGQWSRTVWFYLMYNINLVMAFIPVKVPALDYSWYYWSIQKFDNPGYVYAYTRMHKYIYFVALVLVKTSSFIFISVIYRYISYVKSYQTNARV